MKSQRLDGCIDLRLVPESGQTFLWRRAGDGIACTHLRGGVTALPCPGGVEITPCAAQDVPFWRSYFDLDSDYLALLAPVMDVPLAAAMAACPGLRLLRQPFFETLCAFISSAHNAMFRIRGIQQNLLALGTDGRFPEPEEIRRAGVQALVEAGLGYRAPYLYKSACLVCEGLDERAFLGLSYDEALRQMLRFYGVGEKVADCVLLFSLGFRQAFPVDVWMLRAMEALYGFSGTPAHVKRLAMERFGENAGLAQMYLFHAFRTGRLDVASLQRAQRQSYQCT